MKQLDIIFMNIHQSGQIMESPPLKILIYVVSENKIWIWNKKNLCKQGVRIYWITNISIVKKKLHS